MNSVKEVCDYTEVDGTGDTNGADASQIKLSRWNLIKQVLVSSTMWTLYFMYGLQIGAPTVIIPQLQREANSSAVIDDDLGSWLSSMFCIGALPWTIVLPLTWNTLGRKKTFIFICTVAFIGTSIIYFSKSITHILVGQFISGILLGSHNSISPFIIAEYSSPKYRGLFMTMKSASGLWGIWVANTIGSISHWKNIYLLGFLCNVYVMTVFIWPESPYWLAKKSRFADCAKSYRQLHGTSKLAQKDLDLLINSYENNEDKNTTKSLKSLLSSYLKLFSCKSYYKPLLLSILLGVQIHLTGKLVCSMYAIQILKKITQNESTAYRGMLILDGVTVFSTYCGCVVARFCKRRTMLFTMTLLTIIFLYILTLYLFLIHQSIIIENNIISISLLALFTVTVSSGPVILSSSIYGELISFKHQRSCTMICGVIFTIVMATSFKISLFLFKKLTLPGVFLFFAISSTVIGIILYVHLPETKNKSCHEIENYFKELPETKNIAI